MDKDLDESNLKDKFEKSCENKTTKLQFKFGIYLQKALILQVLT